jgi:Fe-S-cluster-containing hydrogenase component 2
MAVQIDEELCTGCGVCIDACPFEAIQLVDQRAKIVSTLCTQCGACLDACPNGAIVNELAAPSMVAIIPQANIKPDLRINQKAIVLQETKESNHGIKALAGAALSFLGSEVAPRIVDVVIKSIEQRLAQPTATTIPPSPSSSRNCDAQNKGQRKQMRYRGGNKANRKSKGRR